MSLSKIRYLIIYSVFGFQGTIFGLLLNPSYSPADSLRFRYTRHGCRLMFSTSCGLR